MKGTPVKGMPVVAVAFEFAFHGGSMGYVVGERFYLRRPGCAQRGLPAGVFFRYGRRSYARGTHLADANGQTSAVIERQKQAGCPISPS